MDMSVRMKISTLCLVFFHHTALCLYNYDKCPDYNPQQEVDIDLISGIWQGAEIITHFEDKTGVGSGGQSQKFSSCVTITIEEVTTTILDYDDQMTNVFDNPDHFRFLKLSWQEYQSSEYILKFISTRRGFWIGGEAPIGSSMRRHPQHAHFTGTIQVMKAVGSHLVLTFCERNELFTIILFREKNVKAQDVIDSVRGLLDRRGLAVHSVRELCRFNTSNRIKLDSIFYILLPGLLSLLFMKV